MEMCGISEGTVIGQVCRRIPGNGKGSCYLWQVVQEEPEGTRKLLGPIVKRHRECPFQRATLEAIKQQRKYGMNSPENGPGDGSDRDLGVIESLLRFPRNLRDLVVELRRLNKNLESLPRNLDEVAKLTVVLADFRVMVAPLLGWRVKEDPPEESEN